jgi:microcystin-dependent protein
MFRVNNNASDLSSELNYEVLPKYIKYLSLQVGDFKMTSRTTDNDGWLICNGRSLLRSEYRDLFEVIGTDYGSVDENHFNIPDFTSRVLGMFGLSAQLSSLTGRSRGQKFGTETETLTTNQIPSHSHIGTVDSSGSHAHTINDSGHTHTGTTETNGSHAHTINDAGHTHTGTTETNGSHAHTINDSGHTHTGTTDSSGSHAHTITDPGHTHSQTTINDDFNNSGTNPPGFTADSAGSRTWDNINSATTGITINSGGAHTHTITSNSSTTGVTLNTNGSHNHTITTNTSTTGVTLNTNGSHNHTITTNTSTTGITLNTNGSHTHTFTTQNTGNNGSHNNIQPTLFGVNVLIYTKFIPPW